MISCILLSAGLSSRFGSPKALAQINGKTIIEHLLKICVTLPLDQIIVVLGASAEEIKPRILEHKKVNVVYNKNYKMGQTSSFKAGVKNISLKSTGIMLLPVDYPLVKKETFELLIKCFSRKRPLILIPTFKNCKGHPPLFSVSLKKEILDIDDSSGINTIIHNHPETLLCPVSDPGVIQTFNTKEEWEKAILPISTKINIYSH